MSGSVASASVTSAKAAGGRDGGSRASLQPFGELKPSTGCAPLVGDDPIRHAEQPQALTLRIGRQLGEATPRNDVRLRHGVLGVRQLRGAPPGVGEKRIEVGVEERGEVSLTSRHAFAPHDAGRTRHSVPSDGCDPQPSLVGGVSTSRFSWNP